jgi:hypothetical protein
MWGGEEALRCRRFVVGTRFCTSATRSNAEHAALEWQPLPVLLTACQCDPTKTSTRERGEEVGRRGGGHKMGIRNDPERRRRVHGEHAPVATIIATGACSPSTLW